MARATNSQAKSIGRNKTSGLPKASAASGKNAALSRRPSVKLAAAAATASKEELRARIEKLERANATLRAKNKDLRLAHVEASEQLDALTLKIETLERRIERQAKQEAGPSGRPGRSPAAAGSGRGRKAPPPVSADQATAETAEDDENEAAEMR
jgi:hypothetical protein